MVHLLVVWETIRLNRALLAGTLGLDLELRLVGVLLVKIGRDSDAKFGLGPSRLGVRAI